MRESTHTRTKKERGRIVERARRKIDLPPSVRRSGKRERERVREVSRERERERLSVRLLLLLAVNGVDANNVVCLKTLVLLLPSSLVASPSVPGRSSDRLGGKMKMKM